MATIKVIGGSVDRSLTWSFMFGRITGNRWDKKRVEYGVKHMHELALADEATGVKVLGAAGWGTVGALVAGPIGAVIGGVLGGRGETITFVGKFSDGQTMMGQVPKKAWLKMLAERV